MRIVSQDNLVDLNYDHINLIVRKNEYIKIIAILDGKEYLMAKYNNIEDAIFAQQLLHSGDWTIEQHRTGKKYFYFPFQTTVNELKNKFKGGFKNVFGEEICKNGEKN